MTENEPFGRQPKPVKVTFEGEAQDVLPWIREFRRRAEYKGDMTVDCGPWSFTIHHRAINN